MRSQFIFKYLLYISCTVSVYMLKFLQKEVFVWIKFLNLQIR